MDQVLKVFPVLSAKVEFPAPTLDGSMEWNALSSSFQGYLKTCGIYLHGQTDKHKHKIFLKNKIVRRTKTKHALYFYIYFTYILLY